MNKLPISRTEDIIVQNLDKEILIYDLLNNKAYVLNETSSIVFQNCDGITTFDALKRKYHFTDDLIYYSLRQLREVNLIEDSDYNHFAGLSRREVIRRVGLSSMVALPIILSLVAPTAADAQSRSNLANGQTCSSGSQCQSGRCGSGTCCSSNNFQACSSSNDCCSGVVCSGGLCCQNSGRTCDTRSNDCCPGLSCVAAAGQTNGSCQ